MKNLLLSVLVLNLCTVSIFSVFNQERYEQQKKDGWLLGDQYAAQKRQNCNHLLLATIMQLLEKGDLSENEQKQLDNALKVYEAMKCSDSSLYKLDFDDNSNK